MCKITGKYNRKTYTGYKSVVKIGKKLYSPVTGMEYKVGPVPKIRTIGQYARPQYINVLDKNMLAYDSRMVGKTGVFKERARAEYHYGISGGATIEMTISGDLHQGFISNMVGRSLGDLIVGNHIDKIVEL